MTLVHLTVKDNVPVCGTAKIVTSISEFVTMMTGDPRAVTCPLCKKTEVYVKTHSQLPR